MARVEFFFLGDFRVLVEGRPASPFESDKARALLAYLLMESERPHRRDALAGLLWPERPDGAALRNLRQALFSIRQALGDDAAHPPLLSVTHDAIGLDRAGDFWLDVSAFETLAASQTPAQLEEAISLYRGALLDSLTRVDSEPFEQWVLAERERVQRQAVECLSRLANLYAGLHQIEPALKAVWRILELDPWREEAHQQAMRLLVASGQRAAALAQFETCRRVLAEELGAEPGAETVRLYESIRDGTYSAGAGAEELAALSAGAARPARPVGACPYRGLAAFREADAPFYYGREGFVDVLERAVRRQTLTAAIVGSSGSGKSSALFAGLLPRLRQEAGWQFALLRAGAQPFYSLAGALLPLLEPGMSETDRLAETRKLAEHFGKGEVSLAEVIERIQEKAPEASRLLLVVDQFEELYTLCPDTSVQRAFVDELLAVAEAGKGRRPAPCIILLTLRADFMGQALAHRPFADALQEGALLMGPMTRAELRSAIEKPAVLQGAAFEAGLVERILDDVGEKPGNLPLLEFTLTLLWERQSDGWLTHGDYTALGGVEGAVAAYADQVYAALDAGEQEQARRALVQLVRPGEGTEDTRRVALREELGEESWRLIQRLADWRLVVTGRDAEGRQTAEVVHEALIQKWGQYREWMNADRAFRAWQERLRGNLRQWKESGGDEGALLAGGPLAAAENWLAERGGDLSEAEAAYIRAGQTLQARQQRERQRRRQRLVLGLAAGLVIALALAAFALIQRQDALAQRQEAITQRQATERQAAILLAGQAENELAKGYGDRAVLLALNALENYPYTAQAEHALGDAVSYTRAVQQYAGHPKAVTSVAWSPDGTRIASTCTEGNRVDVWDPLTGKVILTMDEPKQTIGHVWEKALHVQWSQDGKRLLTLNGERTNLGNQDYTLMVWDVASGTLLSRIEMANQAEPEGDLEGGTLVLYPTGAGAEIAPRGGRLATLGGDNTALVWDAAWQKPALVLSGHTKGVNSVDWSPDETKLVTASQDGTAIVWDTQTGQALTTLSGHTGRVSVALWSPDGSQIATAGEDGSIRIWKAGDGSLARSIEGNAGEVYSLAWAPNGVRLFSGHEDGSIHIWETASGKALETLRGHQGAVMALKWSPTDDRLVSGDGSGYARVWNAAPSTAWRLFPPQAARGGDGFANTADWSSDGRYLAIAGGDNIYANEPPLFALWDVQANRLLMEKLVDKLHYYGNGVKFSPDNRALIYIGIRAFNSYADTATAYVFDAQSGEIIRTFTPGGEDHMTSGFAWSPDGSMVVTNLFSGDSLVWDYQTGKQVARLPHGKEGFLAGDASWSSDGSKIAVSTDDGNVHVWDARTWQPLFVAQHDPLALMNVARWSPDGKRLLTGGGDLSGGKDTSARIWDAETGKELLAFRGHAEMVFVGTWSPDGRRIATIDNAGVVKVWDSSTGEELLTITVPLLYWGLALWSPDGQHLAIVGNKTLLSVWRVWQSKEELVAYARECCVFRQLTDAERTQFGLK